MRVVTVGFIRSRGCKRRRSRIQTATFSAATAAGPSISTSLIKLRGITFNRDAPTPSTYLVGFNNSIQSWLAQGTAGTGVRIIEIASGHPCLCDKKTKTKNAQVLNWWRHHRYGSHAFSPDTHSLAAYTSATAGACVS